MSTARSRRRAGRSPPSPTRRGSASRSSGRSSRSTRSASGDGRDHDAEMGAPIWLSRAAPGGRAAGHTWSRDRGARRATSSRAARADVDAPRADRCLRADHAVELAASTRSRARSLPALAAGCTMVLKPSEIAPLSRAFSSRRSCEEAGVPAGRLQPRERRWPDRRGSDLVASRGRHGVLYRLDARRGRGRDGCGAHRQARDPGARRQVGEHHPARRRHREDGGSRRAELLHEQRSILQRADPDARPRRIDTPRRSRSRSRQPRRCAWEIPSPTAPRSVRS